MNSMDDSDPNDISFSHDFDPVTIKCEVFDDELIIHDESNDKPEEKHGDIITEQINIQNSMPEFEHVKIKTDPSLLFEDESCEGDLPLLPTDITEIKEEVQQQEKTSQEFGNHFILNKTPGHKQMETQTPSCSTELTSSKSTCSIGLSTQLSTTVSLNKRPTTYNTKKRKKNYESDDEELFTCSFCAMQFRMKKNYDMHLKPNPNSGNLNLPCLYCEDNFKEVHSLENHIKNIHKACKLCDIIFVSDKEYNKHEKLHKLGLVTFYICTCGVEFKDKNLFDNHVIYLHKHKFHFSKPLTRIMNVINYDQMVCRKSIICPYCHINFSDENILINHKRIVHNIKRCISCLIHYKYYPKQTEIIGYNPDSIDFICDLCKEEKKNKKTKKLIYSNCTASSSVPDRTGESCADPLLIMDVTDEDVDKQNSEELNPKTDTNNLNQIDDYPILIKYKCHLCSEKFAQEGTLKKHLNLPDLDNLNLPCLYCKKICENARKLEKHVKKIHHACKICDITFNNKKEISLHKNDHKLGLIIFFVCACGDEFKDFLTFHTHVKFIHKNDKFYINPTKNSITDTNYDFAACITKKICPYCNKTYSSSIDLEKHKNEIHHIYKCESCDNHCIVNVNDTSVNETLRKCYVCKIDDSEDSSSSSSNEITDESSECETN